MKKLLTLCSLNLFAGFFLAPIYAQQQPAFMHDFIGVNTRAKDPVEKIAQFGLAREYHEWSQDVGYGTSTTPSCPQQLIRWNPSKDGAEVINYDGFYQQLSGRVLPTLKGCAPEMIGLTGYNETWLEQKPICCTSCGTAYPFTENERANPLNYVHHSRWLSLFTARYGSVNYNGNSGMMTYIDDFIQDEEDGTILTGLNDISFLENNNEPDKNWWSGNSTGTPNINRYRFFPREFAAMLSADYDGHMNNAAFAIPNTSNFLGIKNMDENVQVVMAGIAALRGGYIEQMLEWCIANRTQSGFDVVPFDVVNIHKYSNTFTRDQTMDNMFAYNPNENNATSDFNYIALGNFGVSPEEDNLTGRINWTLTRLFNDENDKYEPHLEDKEFWLTEFGYDTHLLSTQAALPNQSITFDNLTINGSTTVNLRNNIQALRQPQNWSQLTASDRAKLWKLLGETQGQWLVRSYLELAAVRHNIDEDAARPVRINRATQFCIRDRVSFGPCTDFNGDDQCDDLLYAETGMLKDPASGFVPKKSWYYVQTMRNVLECTAFSNELQGNACSATNCTANCAKIYRFTNPNPQVGSECLASKEVQVIWLPTSCGQTGTFTLPPNSPTFTYPVTLIEIRDGDEDGKRTTITAPMTINISETPVFIWLNHNGGDAGVPTCPDKFKAQAISCDAVRLTWKITNPLTFASYHIYYALTSELPNPADFDLSDPRVFTYADELGGNLNNAVIAELEECTEYHFFLRGVTPDGRVTDLCATTAITTECACVIPSSKFTLNAVNLAIPGQYGTGALTDLFSYSSFNVCDFTAPAAGGWTEFSTCVGSPTCQDELFLTFDQTMLLDVIYLYLDNVTL